MLTVKVVGPGPAVPPTAVAKLTPATPSARPAAVSREFRIPKDCELRLNTACLSPPPEASRALDVYFTMLPFDERDEEDDEVFAGRRAAQGAIAEVFGCDVPLRVPLHCPWFRSISILSRCGCRCRVEGDAEVVSDAHVVRPAHKLNESTLDVHGYLENRRKAARAAGPDGIGPRMLVVSSMAGCGKSMLCRTLANYAARLGYHPLLVDADSAAPTVGFPRCVSMTTVSSCIDPEEEGGFAPTLQYYWGADAPWQYNERWQYVLSHMRRAVLDRCARVDRTRVGGMFVDFPVISMRAVEAHDSGTSAEDPIGAVLATVEELEIDVVVVLGDEWLRWKLCQRLGGSSLEQASVASTIPASVRLRNGATLSVVPFPAHPAATSRVRCHVSTLEYYQRERWRRYFFGTRTTPLKPSHVNVDAGHVRLVQLCSAAGMETMLPLDMDQSSISPVTMTTVYPTAQLVGSVVAVSSSFFRRRALPREASDVGTSNSEGEWEAVPEEQFERKVQELVIIGFAVVKAASSSTLSLLLPNHELPQQQGCCLIVMEGTPDMSSLCAVEAETSLTS